MLKSKVFCFFIILVAFALFVYWELSHERFGAVPTGERQKRIEACATYKDGQFHNTMPDPTDLVKDNYLLRMYRIHFDKGGDRTPKEPIPSIKTDLKTLDLAENILVPLGHSSFYLQLNGVRILIDPVFNNYAAPFSILNKAFDGTLIYSMADMPKIDYILISHDHYDHLDYDTMLAMKALPSDDIPAIITPLGNGAHLEHWAYPSNKIMEGYWFDTFSLEQDITVHILPARHYSSRLFDKNKTLWGGFAITSPDFKMFYSGDSGYGNHIQAIAEKFDGFDLGIFDVGQFNPEGWPHIHFLPEHAAKAGEELKVKRFLPSHNSKFAIALHPWKAPLDRISKESEGKPYKLITPLLGEPIFLDNEEQGFDKWWLHVQ